MRDTLRALLVLVVLASCGGGGGGDGGGTGPEVFYVRAGSGNDRNDGLSPATAFQTIGAAAGRLRAGDTVVVGPGTYNEAIVDPSGGTDVDPVQFLADPSGTMTGDPAGQVIVDATGALDPQNQPVPAFRLTGASYLTLDGFLVTGGTTAGIQVRVASDHVTVSNCEVFRNSGDGILVQSSADVTLFDNAVYNNTRRGVAIVGSPRARLVNNTLVLNEDRGVFIGARDDVPSPGATLRNNIVQDNVGVNVQVTIDPVSSLDGYDPLANLVYPARYQPPDLPRPGDINEDSLFVAGVLGNLRLTESSPARDAAVTDGLTSEELGILRGRTTDPDGELDDDGQLDLGFHYRSGPAPPGPEAQVFYVRVSGDDADDGLSPEGAFATIGRATRAAVAGDQIIVGPGRYREGPISPPSGSATSPVVLRADRSGTLTGDPPGQVLVDADGAVAGLRLTQVEFVVVDGFAVTGGGQSGIQVRGGSRQVAIRNCEIVANDDGIRVEDSRDVLLFDNLVARNRRRGLLIAGTVSGSPDARVIHNTVAENGDRGIFIGTASVPSPGAFLQSNIVQSNDSTGIQVSEGSEIGFTAVYNLVYPLTRPDAYFPRNLPRQEDINQDAVFVDGPGGDFYLGQTTSPAVDSGDPELRVDLREALAARTTDPDGSPDRGRPDRGYHFPR